MDNIIHLTPKPSKVSSVSTHEEAIDILLPRFLGVLWERGQPTWYPGGVKAFIGEAKETKLYGRRPEIELGGYRINRGVWQIDAYAAINEAPWTNVFSAQIASRAASDPKHFNLWGDRCRMLAWKRGAWEDRIVAEKVQPREIAHLLHSGLTRRKKQ